MPCLVFNLVLGSFDEEKTALTTKGQPEPEGMTLRPELWAGTRVFPEASVSPRGAEGSQSLRASSLKPSIPAYLKFYH